MTTSQRQSYATIQTLSASHKPTIRCPFKGIPCRKPGGVCSLRLYERSLETGAVKPANGLPGALRTVCPQRFEEGDLIYQWVSETVLGCAKPTILGELGFLETPPSEDGADDPSDVGRIDRVLLVPDSQPLSWCAMEVQAVYFQGKAMSNDFSLIRVHEGEGLPFPSVLRRPDYRSSGPKRLMPQLQIKVPSLRRWGKKMAVVVDRNFFHAMGKMRMVPHISNCDVAWFVVRYEEADTGEHRLLRDNVYLTTLEDSVEGLTAGVPVSLDNFEERILAKLRRLSDPIEIPPN